MTNADKAEAGDTPRLGRRELLAGIALAAPALAAAESAKAGEAPAAAPPKPEWVPGRAMAALPQEFPPITQAEKDAALLRPKDPPS